MRASFPNLLIVLRSGDAGRNRADSRRRRRRRRPSGSGDFVVGAAVGVIRLLIHEQAHLDGGCGIRVGAVVGDAFLPAFG